MNTLPLKQLQADLLKKYPELERLDIYPSGSDIRLDTIIVKRQFRKSGIGSKVLNDIKSFADSNSKRIILTTGVKDSAWETTSSSRLDKFYRRNGFVANKNRNKDYCHTLLQW
jgi:GNAT superfamily N-acetyltransferase